MSPTLLLRLLAIFAVIGVGWGAGKAKVLGPSGVTVLGAAAFGIFTPALLFRTTANIELERLPWGVIVAYYAPSVTLLFLVYTWQRARYQRRSRAAPPPVPPPSPPPVPPPARAAPESAAESGGEASGSEESGSELTSADGPGQSAAAGPAVRALSMSFSNTVQLGIPVVTALFGAAGLAIHITIASLQSLILLTTGTVLAETDVARASRRATDRAARLRLVAGTARRAFIHPVVLPILLGIAYNLTGLGIPGPVDDVLSTLGQAVVPVSLVTIGLTLAQHGIAGTATRALAQALGKLLLQPAAVFPVAYWVLGLRGLPLTIAVLCAALPIGSNVLLFAQRYRVLEAEATAAIVTSTVGFLLTGTGWLLLLDHLAH